jgi:hypothetical protein
MNPQVFLIGLENVQPDVQPKPALQEVTVRVFVGPHQGKLPSFTLVEAVHG